MTLSVWVVSRDVMFGVCLLQTVLCYRVCQWRRSDVPHAATASPPRRTRTLLLSWDLPGPQLSAPEGWVWNWQTASVGSWSWTLCTWGIGLFVPCSCFPSTDISVPKHSLLFSHSHSVVLSQAWELAADLRISIGKKMSAPPPPPPPQKIKRSAQIRM